MTKYIDREALVEWLKRIPLKDLSDGLGLCRIIMEDDFKKAIKTCRKALLLMPFLLYAVRTAYTAMMTYAVYAALADLM